ncbi:MAG: SDR family NAD(P)-dependent oxidoreductase [Gemmatimonadota bacterium]
MPLFTNHPRLDDETGVNIALCGLYAAGLGTGVADQAPTDVAPAADRAPATPGPALTAPAMPAAHATPAAQTGSNVPAPAGQPVAAPAPAWPAAPAAGPDAAGRDARGPGDRYVELGRLFAEFLDRGMAIYGGRTGAGAGPGVAATAGTAGAAVEFARIGITGAGLGLPGTERVFDERNLPRILDGGQFIVPVPHEQRRAMADHRIVRLVKGNGGQAHFETIDDPADVVKLAGRGGELDLAEEYGFPADRLEALDRVTRLAIAAGLEALRDAGMPLVQRYRTTTTGSKLPDGWALPEEMRDDTGIIFASAFPGLDSLVDIVEGYHQDEHRRQRLADLRELRARADGDESPVVKDLDVRIAELEREIEENPYVFDRRFLFRVLNMGHSQFAEYIGARGPNVGTNGACASGTQAIAMAQDWIQTGRCRRVIVISADDITTDRLMPWFGSAFLASGAAAADERVEDAAIPFDRRRHGLIIGMGGAALVVESLDSARARGIQPITEVLGTVMANSAYHGSRLNVEHIIGVMEQLVSEAEARWGIDRRAIAEQTVFVSHETYTPARGGSASAEILALRNVFGDAFDRIVIANTKGYTGHPMAVAMEDALAVKMLETGLIPPVANYREVDPELGSLNLSRGGMQPKQYSLRLGAGFGSQIAMDLMRWVPAPDGARRGTGDLGYAYRVVDPAAWNAFLQRATGSMEPQVEVAKRTLRVRAGGAALDMQALAGAGAAGTRPVAGASATVVAPAATAAAPAATPPATDPVAARVLAIVADKTGYPPDMLDLELDLEADLGIDTVKQAEMFAAVREEWGIERDDTVALRDYPTLARVIDFVREKRPDLAAAPPVAGTPAVSVQPVSAAAAPAAAASTGAVAAAPGAADPVATKILAIVAEKTGYPEDMLDLELDLEADLGIDTVKQAEMFAAVREEWGIERDDTVALRDYPTLARVIEFVYEKRPELAPAPGATPVADTPTAAAKPADVARGAAPAPGGPTVAATGPGAVTAPASAGAAATTAPGAADPVAARILAIVAEKTGYPEDMLELELDLEADLGIDTVKQAEMFAAVREEWGIERDDDLALRDYPTLARVIEFVYEKRPDLAPAGGVQPAGAPAAVAQPAAAMHPGAAAQPKGATPAPASGNVAPADPAADPVAAKILAIVAEKTGYPEDMLELELDLEADLGIDTVKQAEMFAAVREEWGIERDDDLALRDYPTLARVIEFVYEKRPDLAPGPGAVPVAGAQAEAVHGAATAQPAAGPEAGGPAGAAQPGGATAAALASGWAGRVPEPRLRPLLELTAPTGVELAKGDRVVVFPDHGGVGRALVARLEKRGVEALVAEDTPSAEDLVARLDAWMADGTIKGVYWLPALDTEDLAALDAAGWREALRVRAKLLYTTMRALYEQVGGVGTFLVSGTRLGGMHGYDAAGAVDPLGGAVTGFTKAFKREKPAALVKAVDFAPSRKTAALADVLIEETLRDPGVVEVGHRDGRRWTVGLAERAAHDGEALDSGAGTAAKAGSDDGTALTLGSDSVFVVTGAAGSITSAIIADLATASGGTFHLLDLTPEPDRDDGDLRRVVSDRDGLKRDIFERLKASGERATPALVEKELARLERSAAALSAIEAVESAGGTAHYYAVNLLDADAVDAVVRRIEGVSGRVDALVHAAGLEISRLLPDKEPKEFDLVFDVKADGLFHLLSALGEVPLGAVVVFSSIAGRFGNAGQADYSAANDLMCKVVSSFRTSRPDTRGIAIDWTAWADIGMAARGSIPAIMKQAGIDMLPPAIGVPVVRQELTHGTKGEVVIAGSLGVMVQEFDDAGGLDRGHVQALVAAHGPMVGAVKAMGIHSGLVVETELDPATQPFLHDHQIGGTPVLPGVMGIEAMAEAAGLLFPDLRVAAVENVEFHAPFKFYRSEPRTVTVQASFRQDGDDVVADCRLLGSRMLHGRSEPDVTTHFTAQVRLRPRNESTNGDEATAVTVPAAPLAEDGTVSADDIYRLYFHGPAYQVLDQAWQVNDVVVGRLAGALPPNHVPPERPTLAGPRLVELCFQTAGLRELAADARMGLPYHIDRLELLRGPEAEGDGLVALARTADEGAFDVDLADGDGNLCLSLRGYRTMALPDAVDEEALAPLRRLMDSADG